MRSIADKIEAHLKELLKASGRGYIEIQRSEIAQTFACVPSQINYVLTTRFSPEQGYLVESRRGGGGYLRITKLKVDENEWLLEVLEDLDNSFLSQQAGEGLVTRLAEEGLLTEREALLLKAAISREALPIALPDRDYVRASLLKAVLTVLLRERFQQKKG